MKIRAGNSSTLAGLGDVNISNALATHVLQYNGVQWVNATLTNLGLVDLTSNQTISGVKSFTSAPLFLSGIGARFYNAGNTFYTQLAGGNAGQNLTFTLPAGYGSNNDVLTSDGAGGMSFQSISASSDPTAALLSGRSGGQTLQGGTVASENLILSSTAHATKGYVAVKAGERLHSLGQASLAGTWRSMDEGNSNYVEQSAPVSVSTSYKIVWPSAIGTAGNFVKVSSISGTSMQISFAAHGLNHSDLGNLAVGDDHTQYALLAGRLGGQTLKGSTAAAGNLALDSTSSATKGLVYVVAGSAFAVAGTTGTAGEMRVYDENNLLFSSWKAPTALSQSTTYKMPTDYPITSGLALICDTSGNTSWSATAGASLTIQDIDSAPSYTTITTLQFDQADGIVITNPSTNVGRLDLSSVPVAKLAAGSSGNILFTSGSTPTWGAPPHASLSAFTTDDHTIYLLLAGRSSGQAVIGGTGSGEHITIASTSHATKGQVKIVAGSILASRGTTGQTGEWRSYDEDESHYTGLKAHATTTSSVTYTLPPADGNSGDVLQTNASGVLSWVNPASAGGSITVSEVGGTSVAGVTELRFDDSDGLQITDLGGNITKVDLVAVPVDKLATGTNGNSLLMTGGTPTWGSALIANGAVGQTSYTDGDILYYRASLSTTVLSKLGIGSNGQVLTISSGFPAWGSFGVAGGGTGLTSYTIGDIIYASGTTTLSKLGIGTAGQVLKVNSGATAPEWGAALIAGGGTGLSSFTAGDIVYYASGTALSKLAIGSASLPLVSTGTAPSWALLGVAGGGTGISSFSAGQMLYASGTTTLSALSIGSANQCLSSNGTAPIWASLSVTQGAVGITSYATGDLLYASSSSALAKLAVGAKGTILRVNNSALPEWTANRPLVNHGRFQISSTEGNYADVSSASSIYLMPTHSTLIDLYYNSAYQSFSIGTGISLSISGLAQGMYDAFAYFDGGSVVLETLAWTNATTRATALVRASGVTYKSGDQTRRYVGSFYCNATGNVKDTVQFRHVFSMDNAVPKAIYYRVATASWDYSGGIRQCNGDTTNRVEAVFGVQRDQFRLQSTLNSSALTTSLRVTGIGIDSTSVNSAIISNPIQSGNGDLLTSVAEYSGIPAVGLHLFNQLEQVVGATATIAGGSGATALSGTYIG